VQLICARIGLVSGRGLAGVLRKHYPRPLLYLAVLGLVIANTINAGADLGAIAAALNLLIPVPALYMIVPVTLIILAVQIWGSYRLISSTFKWLTLALLAYIGAALFAHPAAREVLRGTFIPTFRRDAAFLSTLVAILGTTISPYLFFWQTADRVEEMRAEDAGGSRPMRLARRTTAGAKRKQRNARIDVFTGMGFSNLVMFAIITATAATIGQHPQDITSAAQAAEALKPVAGGLASTIFALGFIGSGMLAVPVLAGAGSVGLAGLLGKPWGLSESVRKAPFFYGLLTAGTIGGTLLTVTAIDPIKLLVLAATVNGIAAAPFLVVVMLIADNGTIMGEQRNGRLARTLGWLTVGLMAAAAVAMVVLTFGGG
jgi:NRAMP (natural resistance-associated macrophage protein)-like metal ion transporter